MVSIGAVGMFGMPGIFELLIIGVMLGVPILVAVVAMTASNKRKQSLDSGNLVPCPDCHHGVSTRAQTCPHCGAPLKPTG